MSLSSDNIIDTSIPQSLTDTEPVVTKTTDTITTELVATNTLEVGTTIEEEETTTALVTTAGTEQVHNTDVPTMIPAETYATPEITAAETFIPDISESIESIQPTVTTITLIQEQSKTTESSMISSPSSDSNTHDRPATDSSNTSSDNAKMDSTRIAVITMIIIGVIALIALIMLCIIMKIKKRRHHFNKRISPMYIYHNEKDMSSAMNSRKSLNHTIRSVSKKSIFKDDASFYVDSTTDYQINNNNDDNLSIIIDKPEKLYCNDSNSLSNAMIPNTTPLFPPVHRSNQIYIPSTTTLGIEESTDNRESSQTMGGRSSERYRPSLRNSILLTGQTSPCSSYQHLRQVSSLYSNKQHKMTLWDDDILVSDAWSTEDKQLVKATPKDGRL
ncbi:hypothetical protein BD770DRAFT_444132 [Pilaira anomala]|nr:hypothetical protein BD770DRAFT_444132 [Pilaira anomala]